MRHLQEAFRSGQPAKECTVSAKKVILTIPVEQFTEAEIKVPVKILNCPDSISIKIFPDVVTVKGLVAISVIIKSLRRSPLRWFSTLQKLTLIHPRRSLSDSVIFLHL